MTGASQASADELTDLKADIAAMKAAYTDKIAALEARIAQLEAQASGAAAGAPPAPLPAAADSRHSIRPCR